MKRVPLAIALLVIAFFAASASDATACSVCYGDGSSEMVKGVQSGIVFLAIVIYALLSLVGVMLMTWFFRARKLAALEAAQAPTPAADLSA